VQYLATGYFWENPQKAFSISVEIDVKRFEAVESAKNVCLFALGLEEKFQLVVDNYIEWETELLKQAQASILRQTNKFEAMQHRIVLARRLTNVLTGFRLFVDQADHALSKIFGNPSDELQTIKQFKAKLYDNCFGYRFLEALRNHVQHCDFPKFVFLDEAGLKQRTVELYRGFLEIYDTLKKQNENVRDVSKSFATNAVAPK
jgi:hypothetical protein